jgi:ribosomal protein S18 acetylase RimI-like enzyme
MPYSIRLMEPADLDFAAACTHAEGWSAETRPAFEDFLAYHPAGCFIAQASRQPAGLCVATPYLRHGFIGALIVLPEHRGRGLGTALFSRAVEHLQDSNILSIALDGDAAGIPIYEKAGFRKICCSLRFYGRVPGRAHSYIRQMSPSDLEWVCRLDAELFGDERSFFLWRSFERYPNLCFVAGQAGAPLGYLFARQGEGLISVGPWAVLPELTHPLALLEQLAMVEEGERLRIGVLESNQSAVRILRAASGLVEGPASWRMVLGQGNGPGDNQSLYAIGSAARG